MYIHTLLILQKHRLINAFIKEQKTLRINIIVYQIISQIRISSIYHTNNKKISVAQNRKALIFLDCHKTPHIK